MAATNTNAGYLTWNAVDIAGFWTEQINSEGSAETEDVTHGAGATHIMRLPKLKDRKMDFMVIYDVGSLATYVAQLEEGTMAELIWGPEGNAAGKPCFQGDMILTSVKLGASVEKTKLAFNLSFVQADVPTKTIEGGDTF